MIIISLILVWRYSVNSLYHVAPLVYHCRRPNSDPGTAIPAVAATAHIPVPHRSRVAALVMPYGADMGMVYIWRMVAIPSVICGSDPAVPRRWSLNAIIKQINGRYEQSPLNGVSIGAAVPAIV